MDVYENTSSLVRKILDVSGLLTRILPSIVLVLFCTMMHLISCHLKAIHNSIERQCMLSNGSNVSLLESQRVQIEILKKQHLLVFKAIRKLNQCFGVYLTLEVCYVFVGVINCVMFMLMAAIAKKGFLGLLNFAVLVDQVIHLFLLTSSCEEISNQVYNTHSRKSLRFNLKIKQCNTLNRLLTFTKN